MGPKDIVQIILQSGALGLLALILFFAARYIFPALKDFLTALLAEQRRTNETLAELKTTIAADRELAEKRTDAAIAQVREVVRSSTEECRNSDRTGNGERPSMPGSRPGSLVRPGRSSVPG